MAVLPGVVHLQLHFNTVLAGLAISAQYVATVLSRPQAGRMADTVGALRAAGVGGRFNFLLTDGRVIAATAAGDTLFYRSAGLGAGVVVASEPGDDEPGWTEVPGGSVITATPYEVSVVALATDGRIAIS